MAIEDPAMMSLFEVEAHSFIIRLWQEHGQSAAPASPWRGRVDHVQSGSRRYFQRLEEIPQIIQGFTQPALDDVFESLGREQD
jgi:hypothetical protein